MVRSYRFRLYPNKKTTIKLMEHLELCRFTYNKLLEILEKEKLKNTQVLLPKLKEQYPKLNQVYAKVLQMVNHQLWSNILGLYKKKTKGKKYKDRDKWIRKEGVFPKIIDPKIFYSVQGKLFQFLIGFLQTLYNL